MNIKQIIPVSGSWFVMMRDNDGDPAGAPNPHPIAAWAVVVSDDDDGHDVLPLIAPEPGDYMHKLTIPDADDVIGISHENNVIDSFWTDQAREEARIATEQELRDMATDENAVKAITRLVALGYTDKAIADQLVALDQHLPFTFDVKFLHALSEANLIDSVHGGWITTPLGDLVIKKSR